MWFREQLASGLLLAALAVWAFPGCSAGNPHDINLGTDVAVGFEPPDSSVPDEAGADDVGGAGGANDDVSSVISTGGTGGSSASSTGGALGGTGGSSASSTGGALGGALDGSIGGSLDGSPSAVDQEND
jgi:hypothetical protein